MESTKSSVSINLSNQTNCCNSKKSNSSQFNYFLILGLDYLDAEVRSGESVPVRVNINKSGELTIDGLDIEMVNGQNAQIYSDKKVTTSDD